MELASFFHVAIKVDDLRAGEEFYQNRLGAELLERGHADEGEGATAVNHAAFNVADKRVYLFDQAPYEAAGLVDDVPTGFLHFGFVVDDVDMAYDYLQSEGIEFIMKPSTFGDLKIAFFTDPTGVRIELLEHL